MNIESLLEYAMFASAQLLRKWSEHRPSKAGWPWLECRGELWKFVTGRQTRFWFSVPHHIVIIGLPFKWNVHSVIYQHLTKKIVNRNFFFIFVPVKILQVTKWHNTMHNMRHTYIQIACKLQKTVLFNFVDIFTSAYKMYFCCTKIV